MEPKEPKVIKGLAAEQMAMRRIESGVGTVAQKPQAQKNLRR